MKNEECMRFYMWDRKPVEQYNNVNRKYRIYSRAIYKRYFRQRPGHPTGRYVVDSARGVRNIITGILRIPAIANVYYWTALYYVFIDLMAANKRSHRRMSLYSTVRQYQAFLPGLVRGVRMHYFADRTITGTTRPRSEQFAGSFLVYCMCLCQK